MNIIGAALLFTEQDNEVMYMSKETFVALELGKRGIGNAQARKAPPTDIKLLEDASQEDYVDIDESALEDISSNPEAIAAAELDLTNIPKPKQGKARDPKWATEEKAFLKLYTEYMKPSSSMSEFQEECLLSDLIAKLRDRSVTWAKYKVARFVSAGLRADEEDCLQELCIVAFHQLVNDKAAGKVRPHPLGSYICSTRKRTIDSYFREKFISFDPESGKPIESSRSEKERPTYFIDDLNGNGENNFPDDRNPILSTNPFTNEKRSTWERKQLSRKLATIYLSKLMDYSGEPQKPLAVMYGSVLYQLAKVMDESDKLSKEAAKSSTLSSKEWAFKRMGNHTLSELGIESGAIVERYYASNLDWGEAFHNHMLERTEDGKEFVWADIIYTKAYTKAQTSDWIESIRMSSIIKAARVVVHDPEMLEYIQETLSMRNQFRKELSKLKREV